MNNKYEKLSVEVLEIECSDIIQTSGLSLFSDGLHIGAVDETVIVEELPKSLKDN